MTTPHHGGRRSPAGGGAAPPPPPPPPPHHHHHHQRARPAPPGITPEQEAAAAAAALAVENAKAALRRAAQAMAEGAADLLALAPPPPHDPVLARALHSLPPSARAAGAPPPNISPSAGAREVSRAQPLRARRGPLERLDALPFYVLYGLVVLVLVQRALAGDWTGCRYCSYGVAGVAALHVLLLLLAHWLVPVAAALRFRPCSLGPGATHVRVTPTKFHGKEEVVKLEARAWAGGHGGLAEPLALAADGGDGDLGFEFRQHRFVYDPERHSFGHLRYPDRATFGSYGRSKGMSTGAQAAAAAVRWGLNRVEVPLPAFGALLRDQLLAPFFVFQVFCVGLWCLDEYM
jgi:hypothetical protein